MAGCPLVTANSMQIEKVSFFLLQIQNLVPKHKRHRAYPQPSCSTRMRREGSQPKCLRGEFFLDQYQQLELIEGIEFKIVSKVHFICNAFHSTPAPTVQPVRSFEASPTCAPEPVKIMGLSNWLRRGDSNLRPPCVRESPVRPEDDQSVKRPFCGVRPRAVFPALSGLELGPPAGSTVRILSH